MTLRQLFALSPILYFALMSNAFTFWFTSTPTQCSNTTVQWSTGGEAPFTLLLIPVGHLNPETRTIIQRTTYVGNTISFVLDFPAQSQFVAVLNDGSGVGTGGTSQVLTVASSSDSSCLPTTPSETKFFFFLPNDIGQCDTVDITWQSNAEDPVDLLGLIPGGQSFEIANISDGATNFDWTVDLRSGQDVVFVAGDKDGLGTGGSSDVIQIDDGSDDCIDESSPSSTGMPAAGGVSSAQGGQSDTSTKETQTSTIDGSATVPGRVSTTGLSLSGASTVVSGSNTLGSSISETSTQDGDGSTQGSENSGSSASDGVGSGSVSGFPGSGGGTVTGRPDGPLSTRRNSNLGLILGLIIGLLVALGFFVSAIVFYRRRRRAAVYHNLEKEQPRLHPWIASLARGAHLRGGAGSSVDTLPSMYQTEPFILPTEDQPIMRPTLAARASSSHSTREVLGGASARRVSFSTTLFGVHDSLEKDGVGPHGMPPSRTSSGRALPARGIISPVSSDAPTRVTRDSEDLSPETDQSSPNPFNETFVEIPPTYASVRRASRSSDRESWQNAGPTHLARSNASRRSRQSHRSISYQHIGD